MQIVAAALQDNGRASVLGHRTYGKSTIQAVEPLPGGGALRFTIASYRTPKGRELRREGVIPNRLLKKGEDALKVAQHLLFHE